MLVSFNLLTIFISDIALSDEMEEKSVKTVIEENTDFLMSIQGVVGIAQGLCEDKDCIKVFVTNKTDKIHEQIPKSLDGYMIEIVETDVIKAY
ncbi:MAG: hypothetical protein IID03_08120 [Candidatus Dadabacteria bacterium]|nr:hypothetical protein [Candidatus Dadabacteria bacterium]